MKAYEMAKTPNYESGGRRFESFRARHSLSSAMRRIADLRCGSGLRQGAPPLLDQLARLLLEAGEGEFGRLQREARPLSTCLGERLR